MKKPLITLLALAIAATAAPAFAQSKGSINVGIGVHQVAPKSDNGKIIGNSVAVDVDSDAKPTVTLEYFLADNLGLEVIAAVPFKHDINLQGMGNVVSTKQLPPTISLQYHFNSKGKVSPFIGAGVNYTVFFSEDTKGALAGNDVKLGNSWGLAAHAGLDFAISEKAAIRIDARYADIDTEVKLNGAKIGTANIDPMVYGAAYVLKF